MPGLPGNLRVRCSLIRGEKDLGPLHAAGPSVRHVPIGDVPLDCAGSSAFANSGHTELNQTAPPGRPLHDGFTKRQGQYLAFIHAYTKISGRPPAEADMQRYFRVTPPTVHQMVLNLDRARLIERIPGKARSIRLLIDPDLLPPLT